MKHANRVADSIRKMLREGSFTDETYATRHTYCTAALVAGVPPAYIASQAGHSIQTLLSTYAKWVRGADNRRAKNLLEQAFNGSAESAEERKVM